MSSVKARLAIAIMLLSAPVRADEPDHAAAPIAPARWDLAFRSGWGTVLTTGQSYFGPSFGGAIGRHLTRRLRLELDGLYAMGTSVHAANASFAYRSSVDSAQLALGIGYEIPLGPIVLRPTFRAGGREVSGHVRVGSARSSEVAFYPTIGPSLAVVHAFGRFLAGVEAEALFLPTWVASPSFGFLGFVGIAL